MMPETIVARVAHVNVYTTGPACVQCQATKYWLRKNGIEHHEVRLDAPVNAAKAERFKADGFRAAPVVEIIRTDGQVVRWAGHRVSRLEMLIGETLIGGVK